MGAPPAPPPGAGGGLRPGGRAPRLRAAPRPGPPPRARGPPRRPPRRSSEAVPQACRFERMLAVRTRDLAAQARCRHDLAGIREAGRVERAAQALERVEIGLAEHLRHVLLLVDPPA